MGAFAVYILKSALLLALLVSLFMLFMSKETFHRLNRYVMLSLILLSLAIPFVNVGAVGEVFSEDVDIRQYEAVGLDVPAPRGIIYMSAAFGHESFSCNGDSLVVKEGAEISPLFLWADKVLCHDDLYYAEADPRKQYCKMNIVVVGLNPGEDFEYALRLKADCNAISLYGADALEGNYTVIAKNKNASGYEVLVPRQRENNIVLSILVKTHIFLSKDTTTREEHLI